uniref:NADH-ubiquinone oxidoreductase chain 6 n=1 Tax=Draco maculatus TaxID=89026 RepID=A0A6F8C4H4_9SAUR|nr:NADH dehydrogenase subunit 6 [Draco maculatus]
MFHTFFLSLFFVFGVICVAVSPVPGLSAGVLAVASGIGCGMVAGVGGFFLGLVLFLVYLGGMMVVFAFSVGLSAGPRLKRGGASFFVCCAGVLCCVVGAVLVGGWGGWQMEFECVGEVVGGFDSGFGGVCELYSLGGYYLFVLGWALLLTLFVVLELVRGAFFGSLKV